MKVGRVANGEWKSLLLAIRYSPTSPHIGR
jgi:hypothetical protein